MRRGLAPAGPAQLGPATCSILARPGSAADGVFAAVRPGLARPGSALRSHSSSQQHIEGQQSGQQMDNSSQQDMQPGLLW